MYEKSSAKVASNIINNYGFEGFCRLIDMFTHGTPGPSIAAEFNVSRQRVNQWKRKLGIEKRVFILDPGVESILLGSAHIKI